MFVFLCIIWINHFSQFPIPKRLLTKLTNCWNYSNNVERKVVEESSSYSDFFSPYVNSGYSGYSGFTGSAGSSGFTGSTGVGFTGDFSSLHTKRTFTHNLKTYKGFLSFFAFVNSSLAAVQASESPRASKNDSVSTSDNNSSIAGTSAGLGGNG